MCTVRFCGSGWGHGPVVGGGGVWSQGVWPSGGEYGPQEVNMVQGGYGTSVHGVQ